MATEKLIQDRYTSRPLAQALHVVVDGQPVGKGRPRFSKGRTYTPIKTKNYEHLVGEAARLEMRFQGIDLTEQPVKLHILAQFEIPKSWPKWKRQAALLGIYTPGRPDIDNVAKAVLDAFNGIVYKDDSQVYELTVKKIYGQPLMVATVSWADD